MNLYFFAVFSKDMYLLFEAVSQMKANHEIVVQLLEVKMMFDTRKL